MKKRRALIIGAVVLAAAALLLSLRSGRLAMPSEAARGDLVLREGRLYLRGFQQPYTGTMVEDYSKGVRKLAIDIRDGQVDGLSYGWFEAASATSAAPDAKGQQLQVEEHFVAGVSHGLRTRWHANGQKKSEEQIEHGVITGRYVEWHDNGRKAVEMTLKDGKPDGLVVAWHPDGTLKSQTRFEGGQLVKREFFPASLAATKAAPEAAQP